MQIYPHLSNEEVANVTVRLNKNEMASLRTFMKTPHYFKNVGFPDNVRLFYRSKGWYTLQPMNTKRAIEKLKTAVAVLKRFAREYDRVLRQDAQVVAVHHDMPHAQVVAYVADGSLAGQYLARELSVTAPVRELSSLQKAVPASPQKLDALMKRWAT